MSEIVLHNMSEYPQVLRRIFQQGERRSPRGLATLDLGFTTIVIFNTRGALPMGIGRRLNPAIGALEAVQLIAAESDPQLVLRLAPQFQRYSDPDDALPRERIFWGAYGDRIKMQAAAAIRKLQEDAASRQAVITLWDPWLDNVAGKHDYPCTIALQFFLQDGLLNMNTIMRSNDAWLGLPYDVFQFTQLQASMAHALKTHTGVYRHTVLSLHLYESDCPAASDLIDGWSPRQAREAHAEVYQPNAIGHAGQSFGNIMTRAQALIANKSVVDETESEAWYRDKLHPKSS